jgi:hypothetical protein
VVVISTAISAVRVTASPAVSLQVNRAATAANTGIAAVIAVTAIMVAVITGAADVPRAVRRKAVKPCQPLRFESH